MRKKAFIEALQVALKDLPEGEIQQSIAYFKEMIDDRIEEGMTEEEAVSDMGNIDKIAKRLLAEHQSLVEKVKGKILPKRRLATWEIILLVLGFPIWGSLLLAVVALLFSIVMTVAAIGFGSLSAIFAGVVMLLAGSFVTEHGFDGQLLTVATACTSIGLGLFCFSWMVQLYRLIKHQIRIYRK